MKDQLQKCDNITLHRDGTTKKGRHYYGLEFSIKEKTITAGVRGGKADAYVDCGNEFIGVLRRMQRYFSHIFDGTDVQAE